MLPKGIAHPRQLAVLTKALQEYCTEAHIDAGTLAHHDASRQVMDLYECGFTDARELVRTLRSIHRVGHRIGPTPTESGLDQQRP